MTERRKILIDTDPGIDDAMAIFYALESPELDVIGLTTVFGNAPVDVCTTNALKLLEIAGRSEIPVAAGAGTPLVAERRGAPVHVHGTDGMGNRSLPPASTRAVDRHAAAFIIEQVMAAPGEITLVPLGPLTNIALALALEPSLPEHVREIVLMGGNAFCPGNASPAAEANIFNDPEAADLVFGAGCPIVMAGLDVTERTVMTPADLASISTMDNPRAQHIAAILPHYIEFNRTTGGDGGIPIHDSTTISYLLQPESYRWVELPVRVDTGRSVGRGATIPSLRPGRREDPWTDRPAVRILTEVDDRAVIELELARMRS